MFMNMAVTLRRQQRDYYAKIPNIKLNKSLHGDPHPHIHNMVLGMNEEASRKIWSLRGV